MFSKFLGFTVALFSVILYLIDFLTNGMSLEKTLNDVTFTQLLSYILLILSISIVGGFIVALSIKPFTIEIKNGELIGRNYWGFKKTLPIEDITQLYPFTQNGLSAIFAKAKGYGEVSIFTFIDNFEEIIEHLEANMNNKNA